MRLAVIGTGLMGASVALAAQRRGDDVAGWDPDPDALARAAARGARRAGRQPRGGAVAGAELVVVAAPIAQLPRPVAAVLAATGERDRDRRRLDQGQRRRAPRTARRVSSAATRSAAPRRAAPSTRSAALFDGATWFLTPIAADRPGPPPARARLRRPSSARRRSRSTPTRTTASSR